MIIEVFNLPYNLLLLFFAGLTVFLCAFLKKKGLEYSKKFLLYLYSAVIVYYFVYKAFILIDEPYCQLLEYKKPYFLNELPFQACNILLFTMPVALLTENKSVRSCIASFAFFTGILAILMPSKGMTGESLFMPRILGYYVTHYFVVMEAPLLICTGIYKPTMKNVPRAVLTLLFYCACSFVITIILVKTGLNPRANYFYAMSPDGNPVLEILFKLIPVPGVYILPAAIPAALLASIVVLVSKIGRQTK